MRDEILNYDGEIWKPIEGFPKYMVSSFGRVKRLEETKIDKNGKPFVLKEKTLVPEIRNASKCFPASVAINLVAEDGSRHCKWLAWVVAHAFMEKTHSGRLEFIDGNFKNCRLDNLRYVSPTERKRTVEQIEKDFKKAVTRHNYADFRFFCAIQSFKRELEELGFSTEDIEILQHDIITKTMGF